MTGNYDDIPYPPDYGAPHAMNKSAEEIVEAMRTAANKSRASDYEDYCSYDMMLAAYRVAKAHVLDEAIQRAKELHGHPWQEVEAGLVALTLTRTPALALDALEAEARSCRPVPGGPQCDVRLAPSTVLALIERARQTENYSAECDALKEANDAHIRQEIETEETLASLRAQLAEANAQVEKLKTELAEAELCRVSDADEYALLSAQKERDEALTELSAANLRADIFESAADRYRNAMNSARTELEAVKPERDDEKADALRLHHEKCDALDKRRAHSALIEKAVEALGNVSNEVLGSLGLFEPLARREMGNTNYNAMVERAQEARAVAADLTAAIGKGNQTSSSKS